MVVTTTLWRSGWWFDQPGDRRHAETFFRGLDVCAVDYGPAVTAWQEGRDPFAEPIPMHPSYEDRPGVPDRVFAAVTVDITGAKTVLRGDRVPGPRHGTNRPGRCRSRS